MLTKTENENANISVYLHLVFVRENSFFKFMCLQLSISFTGLKFFLPNICSKRFIMLTKIYYLIKEKFIALVLLLDYLQNYTVESFPSYRSSDLLVTIYLIISLGIRFEAETHVGFLINSVISVYISTKNE